MYGSRELRHVLASLLVHMLIAGAMYRAPHRAVARPPTEIVYIEPGSKSRKQAPKPGVQKTVNSPTQPRVGSPAYRNTKRPLGQHLSAEFYLERLRARIEPHWRRFIAEAFSQKQAAPSPCGSVLSIDATSTGDILAIKVASTTCGTVVTAIGKKSIEYAGLLPPPKDILVNNTLYLEWTFELKE